MDFHNVSGASKKSQKLSEAFTKSQRLSQCLRRFKKISESFRNSQKLPQSLRDKTNPRHCLDCHILFDILWFSSTTHIPYNWNNLAPHFQFGTLRIIKESSHQTRIGVSNVGIEVFPSGHFFVQSQSGTEKRAALTLPNQVVIGPNRAHFHPFRYQIPATVQGGFGRQLVEKTTDKGDSNWGSVVA